MAKSKSIISKDNETKEMYEPLIGKLVRKKSFRPFKSGEKLGTPIQLTINEYSGRIAFIMKEDDSIVDCFRCLEYKEEE